MNPVLETEFEAELEQQWYTLEEKARNQMFDEKLVKDWVFTTTAFEKGFKGNPHLLSMEGRFSSKPYFYDLLSQPNSAVWARVKQLRNRSINLQYIDFENERPRRLGIAGAKRKSVWVNAATAEPFFTDEDRNIIY